MTVSEHQFHIPVMGTGFSADTPIRVAHFGISSVISIVDDLLLEKIREHYHRMFEMPYTRIHRHEEHGRSRRITAYLDTVQEIVRRKIEAVRQLPFGAENDKSRHGRPVHVWAVDDPALSRELWRRGASGIITKKPGVMTAVRSEG